MSALDTTINNQVVEKMIMNNQDKLANLKDRPK